MYVLETIEDAKKRIEEMREDEKSKAKLRLPKKVMLQVAQNICDVYAEGIHSIETCCKAFNIKYWTFQSWAQPDITEEDIFNMNFRNGFVPEIHAMYLKAKEQNEVSYFDKLRAATRAGLILKASGSEYEEVTREIKINEQTGEAKPVSIRKVNKRFLPSDTALIFIAKNVDSDNFADKTQTEHSGRIDVNPFSKLSDADLKSEEAKLLAQLNEDKDH